MNSYKEMIEDNEWQAKEKAKEIKATKTEISELHASWHKAKATINDIEARLEDAKRDFGIIQTELNGKRASQTLLERELGTLNQTIIEMTREQSIQELENKQADFSTVLEERLSHQISELDCGLNGFDDEPKEPQKIVAMMKELIAGNNFGEPTTSIRQAQSFYKQWLRSICEKRVDGKNISMEEKQGRIDLIDRFLRGDKIARLWS